MILIAAITKSAQIPFSAWLPAAMAAPTPVRALVHSSTLVTAGVYLLIRFYPTVRASRFRVILILVLGVLTTVIARTNALLETDFKKTIALSTLSQLGIIVTVLGTGMPILAYFHMLIHALFKALLFICRGKVIHLCQRGQDLRLIGGILYSLPVTCVVINTSNYALCGVPFLAGFYSKDFLVERMLGKDLVDIVYLMLFRAVGLSITYSLRFTYFSLVRFSHQRALGAGSLEEWVIIKAKLVLVGFSIAGGSLVFWTRLTTPWALRLPLSSKYFALLGLGAGSLLGLWLILWDSGGKKRGLHKWWFRVRFNI